MKIVVLDGYAANPGDLSWDELKSLGECIIYDRTAPSEVTERAAGADILLTNKVVLNADTIAALPHLKYIGVLATGYNVVDIAAAKERGIVVTNIPAYSTPSVAQMVFAHILNIAQQVQHYTDEVRKGRWSSNPDFCFWDTPLIELRGKKILRQAGEAAGGELQRPPGAAGGGRTGPDVPDRYSHGGRRSHAGAPGVLPQPEF